MEQFLRIFVIQITENPDAINDAPGLLKDIVRSVDYISLLPWYDILIILSIVFFWMSTTETKILGFPLSTNLPKTIRFGAAVLTPLFLLAGIGGRVRYTQRTNEVNGLEHVFNLEQARGNYDAAAQSLEKVVELEPDNTWAFKKLANFYLRQFNDESMKKMISDNFSEESKDAAIDTFGKADDAIREAITTNSQDSEAFTIQGAIYYSLGVSGQAYHDYHSTSSHTKAFDTALSSLQEAIKINSDWGSQNIFVAYDGKGFTLVKLGQFGKALETYEKAYELAHNTESEIAEKYRETYLKRIEWVQKLE